MSRKILGISGSLRKTSSASAVLKVVSSLMPDGFELIFYEGLSTIPPFDDSDERPLPVQQLIQSITDADAVFICTPEYAFGVPGVLKNALDWTVSSTAFSDKPVALITASSVGDKGHAALIHTLTALGTRRSNESTLLISFIRSKLDESGNVKDPVTLDLIKKTISALIQTLA